VAACPAISSPSPRLWRRPIVVSQRRIDANRRNAARSTGPRTEAGKSRVARNAVRHGFFAEPARWTLQQQRDFIETYDALRVDLRPCGIGEESCIWTLAHEYARMAAVLRYESLAACEYHRRQECEFDTMIASAKPAQAAKLRAHRERMRRAGLWGPTLPGPRAANGIVRCMGSINRAIQGAMRDLNGFQCLRSGAQHPKSLKVRKQTHLVAQNRALSLIEAAAKAHRELLKTARAARIAASSGTGRDATRGTPRVAPESAKTNPLSSMFMGNRHERRRAAALARRRQ